MPGAPVVEGGKLVSTNPSTGKVIGRFPVADDDTVRAAVTRARDAAHWWAGLGFDGRAERLRRWRVAMARRLPELAELVHREGGKPVGDALLEVTVTVDHLAWATRHARRVLGPRRVPGSLFMPESFGGPGIPAVRRGRCASGRGTIRSSPRWVPSPTRWPPATRSSSSPASTPRRSASGWSTRSPRRSASSRCSKRCTVSATSARRCAAAGVDKVAFTGSTATAQEGHGGLRRDLTPVLVECGGKDAMIVDADADLDAAADAARLGRDDQRRPDLYRHRAGLRARPGLRRLRRQGGGAGRPADRSAPTTAPTSGRSPCPASWT